MFNRKTSLPFWISWRNISVFSVAGPSVQMILVLRIDQRIGSGMAKAKTLLNGAVFSSCARNLEDGPQKNAARLSRRAASRGECVFLFQFALSLLGQLKMFLD